MSGGNLWVHPIGVSILIALAVGAAAQGAGRDPLVRVEPPSPYVGKGWKDVRAEQISFAERLEQWGIKIEPKFRRKAEESGQEAKFELKWSSPDELTMTLSFRSPVKVDGFDLKGKYIMRVNAEGIGQGAGGGFGFGGAMMSGEVMMADDTPFAAKMQGEFKKGLAALKLQVDQKAVKPEIEFDLGYANVKVDPLKYARRFIEFVPRFVDAAQAPAEAALEQLAQVNFNPGLVAAARANDAAFWVAQMKAEKTAIEKTRKAIIDSFVAPVSRERDFRRQQAGEVDRAVAAIETQTREYAAAGAQARAARQEFLTKAASAVRPSAPPRPQEIDSYIGESHTSSGGSAREQRDETPRTRESNFHSQTFDYLKSGGFRGRGF